MLATAWVQEMLQEKGVAFEECHHPESYTAQALAQREHISGHHVAKVVAVLVDGRPYALVVPASRNVVLDRVAQLLGAKDVRLASEDEMERCFPGCECGAVPPLRHWQDAEVLMDESMRVAGD